jgi:hypothetical protein
VRKQKTSVAIKELVHQPTIIIAESELDKNNNLKKYLIDRGWHVELVSGSMSALLQVIAKLNPTHLFISARLFPDSFLHLYHALEKSSRVVIFAEKVDEKTSQMVEALGLNRVITAGLTGPAIENILLQTSSIPNPVSPDAETKPRPLNRHPLRLQKVADAIDDSLSHSCVPGNFHAVQPLGRTEHLQYFSIQSEQLSGYLLVASAFVRDFTLSKQIHARLKETVEDAGFELGEIQEIQIEEFQIEALALSYGDIIRKCSHLGTEVAVAFFAVHQTALAVHDSPDKDFVGTSLHNFKIDQQLECDLYLYLPQNKKFVLYKKFGSILDEHQKSGLLDGGCKEIYLKRDALAAYDRYRAIGYLNSIVLELRNDCTEVTA